MKQERPRYRKVSVRIWGDDKFRRLTRPAPNAQTLLFYLITGPHTSAIPGLIQMGQHAIAEALGWHLKGAQRCFTELIKAEIVEADWTNNLIWLPRGVHHNPPESIGVVKAWAKAFDVLPECELKTKAHDYIHAFLEERYEEKGDDINGVIGNAFANAFAMVSVPVTDTASESDLEKEGSGEKKHPVKALLTLHEQLFTSRYHAKPAKYTGKDAQHAKNLITRHGFERAAVLVRQFFDSRDVFIARSGHALGVLASSAVQNRVIAELSGRAPAGDGRDWARDFVANG